MKKILLGVFCFSVLVFGATFAEARDDMPMRERGFNHEKMQEMQKERGDKLAKDLDLTAEQQEKAEKIREEGRVKFEPLMKEGKELHEKMDKLREENMNEFKNILTAEQKEKFEKIKEERRGKFEKFRGDRRDRFQKGKMEEGKKGLKKADKKEK